MFLIFGHLSFLYILSLQTERLPLYSKYCFIALISIFFIIEIILKREVFMRIWAREFKSNHMLKDTVVEDFSNETRTHKIFHALDEICHQFDLSKPIWLESCIADFKRTAKVRGQRAELSGEISNFYR